MTEQDPNGKHFGVDFLVRHTKQITIAFTGSVVSQLLIYWLYFSNFSDRSVLDFVSDFFWLVSTALLFAFWVGGDLSELKTTKKFDNLSYFFIFAFISLILNFLVLLLATLPVIPLALIRIILSLGSVIIWGISIEKEKEAPSKKQINLRLVAALMLFLGMSLFPSGIK